MLDFVINKEEITYLYKVKDGSVSSSFAHLAALSVGLPKNIVDRAKQVIFNFFKALQFFTMCKVISKKFQLL